MSAARAGESLASPVAAGSALGAVYRGHGVCAFRAWAPLLARMSVKLFQEGRPPAPLERDEEGYWSATVEAVPPGTRYLFLLNDDKERPDPASRSQPEGVHEPSEVIDHEAFTWHDGTWQGLPLRDSIIYELHVGAFTRQGTFEAAISRLSYLKELGVTALELMPVSQFPGTRNWGYDGVYPFAPQNSYGGPSGLKALVDACHQAGLAVLLDVVYNHLGPDGNYLNDFGPYFTNRYRTPWGDAVNLDGPYSDGVRAYFIENALSWVTDFHLDGLRLDAIDTIYDFRPRHFLAELAEAVHRRGRNLGRQVVVIAESDLNDARIIEPAGAGGFGLDAQWSDDLHHALHALVTSERKGYYEDFGQIAHLAKAFREGFVYSGDYSRYRKRRHGGSSRHIPSFRFVVCSQNHDQIGNRRLGERLSSLISFEQRKLVAGCVLLSPFIPLLFMGEEYGETAPFQYFVSHIDEPLIEAIRKGRASEFAHFEWEGLVPDPQSEETFRRSKVHPGLRHLGKHKLLFAYYRELIRLRTATPPAIARDKEATKVIAAEREQVLLIAGEENMMMACSFNSAPVDLPAPLAAGRWYRTLDSSAAAWGGPGERSGRVLTGSGAEPVPLRLNPHSIVLYSRHAEAVHE